MMDYGSESFYNLSSSKFYIKISISIVFGIILNYFVKPGKKSS